jgi:hypothetical protein
MDWDGNELPTVSFSPLRADVFFERFAFGTPSSMLQTGLSDGTVLYCS